MSKAIDWIKDHKKALVIGGVVIVTAACGGCYIYRLNNTITNQNRDIKILRTDVKSLRSNVKILKSVMSDNVLSSLKSTLTRKLRYAEGRLTNGLADGIISDADIKIREEEIEFFTNELLKIDEAVKILNQ